MHMNMRVRTRALTHLSILGCVVCAFVFLRLDFARIVVSREPACGCTHRQLQPNATGLSRASVDEVNDIGGDDV